MARALDSADFADPPGDNSGRAQRKMSSMITGMIVERLEEEEMKNMPELTYELKSEFVRRLCTLTDEEKVAVLDKLATNSGWKRVVHKAVQDIRKLSDLLHDSTDEQIVALLSKESNQVSNFLDKSPEARLFTMLLPFHQRSTISCKLPNNEHNTVVSKYYKCTGRSGNIHHFCLEHSFRNMRCPIDNTSLTITQ